MNRLTIVLFRGAAAPGLSSVSSATRTHRYRVDGSTDENLLWVEVDGRQATERPSSDLSLPRGEVFTFDLATKSWRIHGRLTANLEPAESH